jgi:hypothetical protein
MLVERLPQTRASRVRRQRTFWPVILAALALIGGMAIIGAIAGMLLTLALISR